MPLIDCKFTVSRVSSHFEYFVGEKYFNGKYSFQISSSATCNKEMSLCLQSEKFKNEFITPGYVSFEKKIRSLDVSSYNHRIKILL